ncbi:K(+) efflux antiporter 5 [Orobanche gracilis]
MERVSAIKKDCRVLIFIYLIVSVCAEIGHSTRSRQDIRQRFYGNLINSTAAGDDDGSIAKMFDRVLEKEFSENDQPEGFIITTFFFFVFFFPMKNLEFATAYISSYSSQGTDGSSFNSSVSDQQAELETVAKITHEKLKRNDTEEANSTKSFQLQDVFSLENEDSEDVETLTDKKDNVFVISNKKSKYPVLQVDFSLCCHWWNYHFLFGTTGYCRLSSGRINYWTWRFKIY